jgi:hypothetical protein
VTAIPVWATITAILEKLQPVRAMRLLSVLCLVVIALVRGLAAGGDRAILTTAQASPTTMPTVQEMLRMAGEHVAAFGRDLEGIVAHEEYVQTVRQWPASVPKSPGKGRRIESRHLRSDLLLVHDPAVPWQVHRDVLAVDGSDLPGREQRLRQLFLNGAADTQALLLAIIDDSARYNLGHIERNINIPTFPMIVLHPTQQARFAFRDRGTVVEDGRPARLLTFLERGRPRVIRDRHGRDVRIEGRVLLDESSGELLRATVEPRATDLYSHLEVTFDVVDGAPRRVPVQMWEWYWLQGDQRDRYVEGFATYHSFRRFTTEVSAPRIEPRG